MKLECTTISPVILSPRMQKALYKGVDFKGIFFSKTKPSDVSEDGEISFLIYQSTDERYMYELILYLRGLHQAFGVNAINDKEFSYED